MVMILSPAMKTIVEVDWDRRTVKVTRNFGSEQNQFDCYR